MSSCTSTNKMMREPNVRVELERNNFELSDQVSAKASQTKIVGIDFQRLFNKETGEINKGGSAAGGISIASIPVIGSVLAKPALDVTANYALYNLMNKNKGYDVVFYPQYEVTVKRPVLGIGFLYRKTEVTATARLGKLQ